MAEADRPAASGEAARTAQGGLAVRLQLRRPQPAPATQTDRAKRGVRPRQSCARRLRNAFADDPQRPAHTGQNAPSNRIRPREPTAAQQRPRDQSYFNKFLGGGSATSASCCTDNAFPTNDGSGRPLSRRVRVPRQSPRRRTAVTPETHTTPSPRPGQTS